MFPLRQEMEESNDIPSSTLTVPLLHQEVQQPRLEVGFLFKDFDDVDDENSTC